MELLQILNLSNLLIFTPASIALTVAFIAIRGRYIHDFRTFDLNFFSNQILSKASKNRKTARAYKKIAKSLIIRSLQYKCKALLLTFPIVYMFFASLFFISAIFVHNLFLVLAFPLALLAVISFIFEDSLHLLPRKSHKMWNKIIGFLIKRVIWLNSLVPRILKRTSFGIKYLSSWEEINDEIKKLKKFIEKDEHDYFIRPLREYNLLP